MVLWLKLSLSLSLSLPLIFSFLLSPRFRAVAADMARKSGLTSASIAYIDGFDFALDPEASRVNAERVLGIDPVARLRRERGQDCLRADDAHRAPRLHHRHRRVVVMA